MWSYALRRAFFRLVGLLLLVAALSAGWRFMVHQLPRCWSGTHCLATDAGLSIPREGFGYLVWQTGAPPWDYWPLAVMLLTLVACVDLALMLRSRLRAS